MKNLGTDKELVDLIVKTLENHEEHYILGSWENFARARNRKRRFIFWLSASGIAASLMIGWFGYRIFLTGSSVSTEMAQVKMAAPVQHEILKSEEKKENSTGKSLVSDLNTDSGQSGTQNKTINAVIVNQHHDLLTGLKTSEPADRSASAGIIKNNFSSENAIEGLPFRYRASVREDLHIASLNVLPPASTDIISDAPYDDDVQVVPHKKRFRMGINVAPGMTTTSTVSSFNYSGGINAEIFLTDNLHISTGLQLEHQSAVNKSTDTPSWLPAGQTQALLTDLDLPVNLTWKFLNRKTSSYYVTGGISSVAYLSEKYINTNYTQKIVTVVNSVGGNQNFSYELTNVRNTSNRAEDPLSTFDIAGRVNIIFGVEQHLSEKLFLHIEPYVKIPISGQAAEHLRFTTSGITCKLSF